MIAFRLLVLRSARLDEIRTFYERLGLVFIEEQHGSGPVHFAARMGEVILELYPLAEDAVPDGPIRLGFAVADVAATVEALRATGIDVPTPPRQGPWGLRAIARDPDGRFVELTQA
jgi:predicted enzyme related to lactoylglutathione lyase